MTKLGVLDVCGTKYTLKLGETYLIGIKTDNYTHDIEIDDASVDIKHCIFDFTERLPKLCDLRSKFGTFVDGMRVAVCQMIPLVKSTPIQFGDVEATLQLLSESDSGYLEGRLTPPAKDTSDIICNSPEHAASSGNRLKRTLKNSLTSTPNATTITNNAIKDASEFLIPTGVPRKSMGSNTSARSVDSFYIPETQCPVEINSRPNNSINVSIDTNESKNKSAHMRGEDDDDDDFFIPETQEVCRLPNYPRVAFTNENIHEFVDDGDKVPSSQFRICTQDFNGSDDNLSNHSDDILANVPCSLIIPQIHHSPVRIDDMLNPDDDEQIEKEMSALQWSKRTGDDAGSATPDVNPTDGSITPDIIEDLGKVVASASVTLCDTPGMFANPEQSDCEQAVKSSTKMDTSQDIQPTQVFVKPSSMSSNIIKPPMPPCDKENIGPQKDDFFLPSTQVFMPPPVKVNAAPSLPPPPPPPTPVKVSSFLADDDLPPTQVFQKEGPAPAATSSSCFSSTLLDNGMQLSENSFRAKCNKFLDSDDDEMDEVIAPELVKKMRESLEQLEAPKTPPNLPAKGVSSISTPTVETSSKKEKTLKDESKHTPKNKFDVPPTRATKKSSHFPAVSIDNFLFTPDFLGKEFSKDKQLQELAEVNWKNIISEKQCKSLFGSSSSESDVSQDSFNDLLPIKAEQAKNIESAAGRVEKPNAPEKQEAEGRITRRRKSVFEKESKNEKVARKMATVVKLKSEKNEKRELVPTVEPNSHDSKHKSKTSVKEEPATSERIKLRRHTHKNREDTQNDDKEAKAKPKPRMSEKSSTSKVSAKRTTRQSSKDEIDESKHHNEHKSNSHDRSNSVRDKTSDHDRNGLKQKAPEKKGNKDNEKKADKEDASKRRETKAKEPVKQEGEVKHLARLTRLRSAKDLTKADAVVSKKLTNREKNDSETSRGSNDTPNQEPTTSKDRSHHRKPKVDATSSSLQETTQNTKPTSSESTEVTKSSTTKRKNQMQEPRVKRLRSISSTDSVISVQSNESRRLRRQQKLKIAMTMCDPRYQEVLEKHSGALWLYTKDPKECDVMVVEKGNRTFKIMVAIARGIPVVKLDWLVEVLKQKTADIPYEQYVFENPEFENRHQFEMKKSLHLARTTHLLEGMSFLMTPGIRPIPSELKDIIVCAGGTVLDHIPKPQEDDKIYLVSETKDQKYWHQYRRTNPNIKIVSSEGVMASVMQQSKSPLRRSVII